MSEKQQRKCEKRERERKFGKEIETIMMRKCVESEKGKETKGQ